MSIVRPPRLIGWREWLSLETFGIDRIKVKVDTGARTSALHAFAIESVGTRGGVEWIRFVVHPAQRSATPAVPVECPLVGHRWVRSSDGRQTLRPVVRCRMRLGLTVWNGDVTLVRRDLMGFRMLLGRRALKRRFLVDCSRSFLGGLELAEASACREPSGA